MCGIDGCDGKVVARGWCSRHYQRWRKYGDPTVVHLMMGSSPEDRFFAKFVQGAPEDCWIWQGAVGDNGYGYFHASKMVLAHRFSYEHFVGPIPQGYTVDHRCHNRACVNPNCLRLATHKQNKENHPGGPTARSTTGVRGVFRIESRGHYRVAVQHNGKKYYGGVFPTVEDAAPAAAALRNRLHTFNDKDRVR